MGICDEDNDLTAGTNGVFLWFGRWIGFCSSLAASSFLFFGGEGAMERGVGGNGGGKRDT